MDLRPREAYLARAIIISKRSISPLINRKEIKLSK